MTWIEQVAQATGLSVQSVRLALQNGWEIGTAIKLDDSRVYTYIPYPQKIRELLGIEIDVTGGKDDEKSYSVLNDRYGNPHSG